MRIGIDLDGVVIDTIKLMAEELSKHLGIQITTTDIIFHFNNFRKDAEDFIAKNLDYFYNSLDPIKGAVETINYLNKHHKVSIITARKIHAFDITEKWLIKNSINYSNLCLTNGSSKVKFCKQLGIDIIIEDSSPNALEISSSGIPVILITTEYNSNLKGNMITHCKDWKEIRNAIKTFEKKLLICK